MTNGARIGGAVLALATLGCGRTTTTTSASPPPRMTGSDTARVAHAATEQALARIRASGPAAQAARSDELRRAIEALRAEVKSDALKLADPECYRDGCIFDVAVVKQSDAADEVARLAALAKRHWGGPAIVRRSGASDGEPVGIVVVLLVTRQQGDGGEKS